MPGSVMFGWVMFGEIALGGVNLGRICGGKGAKSIELEAIMVIISALRLAFSLHLNTKTH